MGATVRGLLDRAGPPPAPPTAPSADPPAGVKAQVATFLGLARASETELLDALTLVAERHKENYELSQGATATAIWSTRHLDWLEPFETTYGSEMTLGDASLRRALLHGPRTGTFGELRDLCDLSVLTERAEIVWTVLYQGARELHDQGLQELAGRARDHNRRQIAWIRTEIDHLAPDALSIPGAGG
jgi:hypothetical protein